jgi:LSD1 subclass zinc finger protein
MPRVVSCSACRQSLTLPDQVLGGQQIRCPACKFTMVVPGASSSKSGMAGTTQVAKSVQTDPISKPVSVPKVVARPSNPPIAARPVAASVAPVAVAAKAPSKPSKIPPAAPPPEVLDDDEDAPVVTKKKKKKKKDEPNKRMLYLGIGAMVLFVVSVLTCLIVFIPWGKAFSSTPEAQIVDAYTAINSMGYNNAALQLLNENIDALCIPGPRQIVVTRPNPKGKYVLLRLKVPYSDIDRHFQGVRQRIYLVRGHIQIEHNGSTKDAIYVQSDVSESGNFQMSFQPPKQDTRVELRDYIGPKTEGENGPKRWTHQGTTKEYASDMTFEDDNGMQVVVSTGSERTKGGGNIFEHVTGKKILGDKEAFTGGVGGYIFVDWNLGSAGFIVHGELEQPNELGTNWHVTAIAELPEGATTEVTLKAVGTTRKLRLK